MHFCLLSGFPPATQNEMAITLCDMAWRNAGGAVLSAAGHGSPPRTHATASTASPLQPWQMHSVCSSQQQLQQLLTTPDSAGPSSCNSGAAGHATYSFGYMAAGGAAVADAAADLVPPSPALSVYSQTGVSLEALTSRICEQYTVSTVPCCIIAELHSCCRLGCVWLGRRAVLAALPVHILTACTLQLNIRCDCGVCRRHCCRSWRSAGSRRRSRSVRSHQQSSSGGRHNSSGSSSNNMKRSQQALSALRFCCFLFSALSHIVQRCIVSS
jgi:hypothetical protein